MNFVFGIVFVCWVFVDLEGVSSIFESFLG